MKTLTRDQARMALLEGRTLGVGFEPDFRRKLAGFSSDGGATWCESDSLSEMSQYDHEYHLIEVAAPAKPAPRDYRAERDALRLRLDEALDLLARCDAASNEWKVVADYAGAGLSEVRAKLDAAEAERDTLRVEVTDLRATMFAVESAYAAYAKMVAPLFTQPPKPPTPQWPAVGETAAWTTVWDHLKAEPRARYRTMSFTVKWSPRENAVVTLPTPFKAGGLYTMDGRDFDGACIPFTRLPDEESP